MCKQKQSSNLEYLNKQAGTASNAQVDCRGAANGNTAEERAYSSVRLCSNINVKWKVMAISAEHVPCPFYLPFQNFFRQVCAQNSYELGEWKWV